MLVVKKLSTLLFVALLSLASMQVFAVSDMSITNAIQKRISDNAITANSKIDVTTRNGVVHLSGNVMTENEASSAIEAANSVDGVTDVNTDKLMIKDSSQPYEDAYITAKVKGAFVREKLFGEQPISAMSISVETKNGVVFLTGTAGTKQQETTAVRLANQVSGVKSVESKVVIQP